MTEPTVHCLVADDGHAFEVIAVIPEFPRSRLIWMSAMGVAARNYIPLAQALAAQGIAVYLHEWRGIGSSSLRAARNCNWSYRQILELDVQQTQALADTLTPGLPSRMGGHSLGGQLASCYAGLHPEACGAGVWLVCSGSPYWRLFKFPHNLGVLAAYLGFPLLARIRGFFPGKRLQFAGNEARSMMRDWSRTALTGRYKVPELDVDFDALMAKLAIRAQGVVTTEDWLAPASSMEFLLGKFARADRSLKIMDAAALGLQADHFSWMRQPQAIAEALIKGA